MDEALSSYVARFGVQESDLYHVLRALNYFEEAEGESVLPDGMTLEKWQIIKQWFSPEVPEVLRQRLAQDPKSSH